jgi:hypothetical protein
MTTKRARKSMKRTSLTSIARMEPLFRQDKLSVEEQDPGPLVVALREAQPTGIVGGGGAADAADRVAAAVAGNPIEPK